MRERHTQILLAYILLSIVTVSLAPFVGISTISLNEIVQGVDQEGGRIFWDLRVPRVIFAFLAGAALTAGGIVFQALFRNILASPFTLGVSSGAAFGAAISTQIGFQASLLGLESSALLALAGAIATVVIVYGIAELSTRLSSVGMLLAGVVVNFFFSSLILLMQYISDFAGILRINRWLMGNLDVIGFATILKVLPFIGLGLFIALRYRRELDLIALGEEFAQSKGVAVKRIKLTLFLGVSLMVGAIVSFCGPIGFVGIMAPHICRSLIGYQHRFLMPLGIVVGGAFLVVCDLIARMVIPPYEIPVGVITALLGGPFFLVLLLSSRKGTIAIQS